MLTMRPWWRAAARESVRHVEHAVEVDRDDVLPVLDHGVGSAVKALRRLMPALFTRIEMLPTSPATFVAMPAGLAVRHVEREGCALPPALRICWTVSDAAVAIHVEHDDRAPSRA
jgi:hypothetical protein